MAPAVRTAIGEILAGADGSADEAITTLTDAHRYHEDVWAGA
jgi:sulfite reductase alpha subunit-like flavoprotein